MEPINAQLVRTPRRKRAPIGLIVLAAVAGVFLIVGACAYLLVFRPVVQAQQSQNQLKNILLAVHNFHDANKKLPDGNHYQVDRKSQYRDATKVNRFSWRVELLPYIDRKDLYDRFKFDEPWDSEHNLKVAQEMPAIYRAPDAPQNSIHTSYVAIADPEGAFPTANRERPDRNNELSFGDFVDGMRTIAMVQVRDSGIIWTEPRDLSLAEFMQLFEAGQLAAPQTANVRGNLIVGNMDGSVSFLPRTISPKTARALCTRNGHERITPADFK